MLNIKDDSRKVVKGDTFIALKKQNDGHDYIEEAIKNGATKIIAEHGNYSVETVIVEDTHEYLINYLKENYYDEIKDLKLIGMTGTNGKTTTCYLIYEALNLLKVKTAYIGTIGFYMEEKVRDLSNTTPDILELYEILLECKRNNIEFVVMEVSSHSLAQNRVKGLEFEYGIFSNLTEDHLDYHKTIENYLNEKLKLFDMVKLKTFVNIDDEYGKYFIKDNTVTYGMNEADYQIKDYDISLNGSVFSINNVYYKSKLIGKHNIYNLTALISLLSELHLDFSNVIELLTPPVGRMDIIRKDNNIIMIDYAHTPDAVMKIITSVKELKPEHIITIIGCGGNRDRFKRPIMGSIASNNSDYVIFTSDNPRDENPEQIISDMIQNLDKNNYEIEVNRKKAIIKGIQMLEKNDILLVLGKGHEMYQTIGKVRYEFNDKKIVIENI